MTSDLSLCRFRMDQGGPRLGLIWDGHLYDLTPQAAPSMPRFCVAQGGCWARGRSDSRTCRNSPDCQVAMSHRNIARTRSRALFARTAGHARGMGLRVTYE
jgi:hypothetical protein